MMKFLYKLSFLFLLVPAIALGTTHVDKKKHEKSKKVSETFKVDKNATLTVSNKYGNINVSSWDKNTIQIDVNIVVKGDNLSKVEDKLNEVQINFTSSNSQVRAETRFSENDNSWSWWKKNNNINYQIDYNIKIPVSNHANLNNDYGNIMVDRLEGEANINCDYGKIMIGDLMGDNTSINLDYSKGSSITSMKNGSINLDYSSLDIKTSADVKINADYSNLDFEKVNSIVFNTDYGSVKVGDVEHIDGNGDYTGIDIGTLRKSLKIRSDYGKIRIDQLAKGFESVDIDSEYASIKIGVANGVGFDFMVDLQYAGFSKGNSEVFKSIEKNTKKYYEGKYNKGGNSKVTIKSQFGSVSFYDN